MGWLSKVKQVVRWARITAAGSDTGAFPVQQVTYHGKAGDCLMIFPYGHHANLTPDSLVAMFAVEGDADNRAGIGWTPKTRPELKAGEVAIYHPPTGTIIKFNEQGGINVNAVAPITVDAPEVTVTAPDITMNSTNHTINTTNYALNCTNGTGNMGAGSFDFTGDLTSNGKDISDTHTHGDVEPGAGNTGTVN